VFAAKEERAEKDRKKWAGDLHEGAAKTIEAYTRKMKKRRTEEKLNGLGTHEN